jgi:ComF family protein
MKYSFIDLLYPKQCVCCREIIDESEELCDNCIRNIERVDDTKRCIKCGLIKGKCGCKIYTYYFEGVVAPFFNIGLAKQGMYRFKLKRKSHLSRFFANEMAKTVRSQLQNLEFDAVCYVPSSFSSYLKRGFNQSYLLAERLSSLLSIPILKGCIRCRLNSGAQHRLNREKRFEATQKKYYFSENAVDALRDKRILLVDDIKTTGATLDECSRQLLLGGAKSVFCVTALVSDFDNNACKEKRK